MQAKPSSQDDSVPQEYACPITQSIMLDPVLASDGHTYERKAIEAWLDTCKAQGHPARSPLSGALLSGAQLFRNHSLRNLISDFLDAHPSIRRNAEAEAADGVAKHAAEKAAQKNIVRPDITSPSSSIDAPQECTSCAAVSDEVALGKILQKPESVLTATSDSSGLEARSVLFHWSPSRDGTSAWECHEVTRDATLGHKDRITCMSWSMAPSGPILATGSRDKTVKIWAGLGGDGRDPWKVSQTLEGHSDWVNCLASLHYEGEHCPVFVSGSRDRSLRLWSGVSMKGDDVVRWECSGVFQGGEVGCEGGHQDFVTSCALARNGGASMLLASGGADWEVNLWDPQRAELGPIKRLSGHSYAVRCVAFDQEYSAGGGLLLASGGDDETVRVWDPRAKGGGRVKALQCGSPALCCCWGGGTGGSWLAAGGGTPLDSMAGTSENVRGGWLRVWDARTWGVVGDCNESTQSSAETVFVGPRGQAASPGAALAPAAARTAEYLNCPSRMCEGEAASRSAPRRADGDSIRERAAHSGFVSCCCRVTTASGQEALVSAGEDKKLSVWRIDASAGKPSSRISLLASLAGPTTAISACIPIPLDRS